jgi:Txe/YoeB family toxin of Txe-Axe toxin-antitoxin module
MKKYQIKFKNSSVEGSWYSLVNDISKPMERCKQFLQENPEDRLKSGGKLKKLQGKWKGILQYDITHKARVHYKVGSGEHIVYVEYIGYHP